MRDFKSCANTSENFIPGRLRLPIAVDIFKKRPWCSGNMAASQASVVGSIPIGRSFYASLFS